MKAIILISILLIFCRSSNENIYNQYIKHDLWIAEDLLWEKVEERTESASGVLIYLNPLGSSKFVFARIYKIINEDSLIYSLTEGGAIFKGSWTFEDSCIIINNTLISKKNMIFRQKRLIEINEVVIDSLRIINKEELFLLDGQISFIPCDNLKYKYQRKFK